MQKANCWLEGAVQTTYTYDVANELLKELVGTARTAYAYDANGNRT